MRATKKYLSKLQEPLIEERPSSLLSIVVTIPAYNEAETIKSIDALLDCDHPKGAVEVLVNINYSETVSGCSKKFNKASFQVLENYAKIKSTDNFRIYILFFPNQDSKIAGVGWARKQLMDEAFRRLLGAQNEDGIITGFDADSSCQKNYLVALEDFFESKPRATGCSIKFEHNISGDKFSLEIYQAIILYELHLRYFINAQKLIGTPSAFQTVGSSFAVKAKHYAAVNGMSPKKAGEDFYFLQKVIALGHFYQLNTTCVYPSSRISNRVGFGTGPSVGEISQNGKKLTYNYKSFKEIKKLFDLLPSIYEKDFHPEDSGLAELFIDYLIKQKIEQVVRNLKKNNKSFERFKAAFMQWFGGFQILKVLNILRQTEFFQDLDVVSQVNELGLINKSDSALQLLNQIRVFDASV